MVLQYLLPAGVAALALKEMLSSTDADHDTVVENTYDALEGQLPADANIYADHLSHRSEIDNPRGEVEDLTHVPDVVVKAGSVNSLLIEVETGKSLAEKGADAKEQLDDFRKSGYRCVLVVPEDAATLEGNDTHVEGFDQLEGVYVRTPSTVADLL